MNNRSEGDEMSIRELIAELLLIQNIDKEITIKTKNGDIEFDINRVVEKEYGIWIEGEL